MVFQPIGFAWADPVVLNSFDTANDPPKDKQNYGVKLEVKDKAEVISRVISSVGTESNMILFDSLKKANPEQYSFSTLSLGTFEDPGTGEACSQSAKSAKRSQDLVEGFEPKSSPRSPAHHSATLEGDAPGPATQDHFQSDLDQILNKVESREHDSQAVQLIDAAIGRSKELKRAARGDDERVSQPYENLSLGEVGEYLDRAEKNLRQAADTLSQATSGFDASERQRFANTYRNAADLAETGRYAIADYQSNRSGESRSLFERLFQSGKSNDENSVRNKIAQILGGPFGKDSDPSGSDPLAANTEEALAQRAAKYFGLPDEDREGLLKRLALAEEVILNLKDGKKESLPILHNGYIWGGGDSGLDCSSFVSSLLPTDVRRSRYTTYDFYAMFQFLKFGQMPRPPKWDPNRRKIIEQTAEGFLPVDLYKDEPLRVGDLLVFRPNFKHWGHVFLVRDFNYKNQTATVIEAAQSAGTIRERFFKITVQHPKTKALYYRPGIFALRLKQTEHTTCQYDASARSRKSKYRTPARGETGAQIQNDPLWKMAAFLYENVWDGAFENAHAKRKKQSRTSQRPTRSPASYRKPEHVRLKFENDFKRPEDVVRYYVGRDASGFVWSGMLGIERKEFTAWEKTPQYDSFLIANHVDIQAGPIQGADAKVIVQYVLSGVGDGRGASAQRTGEYHSVVFDLRKISGRWKIVSSPPQAPVVVPDKFPLARAGK